MERKKLAMDGPRKNVLIMKMGFKIWEKTCAKKRKQAPLTVTWVSRPFKPGVQLWVSVFSLGLQLIAGVSADTT